VLFVILVVYAFTSICFAYFVSLFVRTISNGFSFIACLNIFFGLLFSIYISVEETLFYSKRTVILGLIARICPFFGIVRSIKRFISTVAVNSRCAVLLDEFPSVDCNGTSLSSTCCDCTGGTQLEKLQRSQDGSCFQVRSFIHWWEGKFVVETGKTVKSWVDLPGIGQELVCAVIAGIFYFLLVLCIDCGFFKPLFALCHYRKPEIIMDERDVDVMEEAKRIEAQLSAGQVVSDAVVLSSVTKMFGSFPAVNNLTFGVRHGECFGLLGVNGAGKTTSFRILTGDTGPSHGNAFMGQYNIRQHSKTFLNRIGYCPQFDAILGVLSGKEMLQLFSRLRGIPNTSEETTKWLSKVGLLESANVQCRKYSGGMKRRLSTAMALIGDPPVVMLDEPTAGVDPVARRQFWGVIRSNRELGQAIILTSHSMDECEALCSRLAIMVNGQFQCFGGVQHIKSKYGQGFTLTFKLKPMVPQNSPRLLSLMVEIETHFRPCELKDRHENILQYQIYKTNLPWKNLFEILEDMKINYEEEIEDYSASETTLDEVFLSFARQQYPARDVCKTLINPLYEVQSTYKNNWYLYTQVFLQSNLSFNTEFSSRPKKLHEILVILGENDYKILLTNPCQWQDNNIGLVCTLLNLDKPLFHKFRCQCQSNTYLEKIGAGADRQFSKRTREDVFSAEIIEPYKKNNGAEPKIISKSYRNCINCPMSCQIDSVPGTKSLKENQGQLLSADLHPFRAQARWQKKRRRDRALANKFVTWEVYRKYLRYNKHSITQTILASGVSPLVMIMGFAFLMWGFEEHLEAETMFSGMSPTQLFIPVTVTGSLFIFSGSCLFLSFATELPHLVFVSIPGFLLSYGMMIFLVVWIVVQTSTKNVTNYLKYLVKSYHLMGSDRKTVLMDTLQEHFSCCGAKGPTDWIETQKFPYSILPTSCCLFSLAGKSSPAGTTTRNCQYFPKGQGANHWSLQQHGCVEPLKEFLILNDFKGWVYIAVGFFTLLLTTILIIFHLMQTCTHLSWVLKPELRKQLGIIVDGAADTAQFKDENYILDLKEFIKKRLNKCRSKAEVKTLLETFADTLHYINHQKREDLVCYILQGKPELTLQFETVVFKTREKEKKRAEDRYGTKPSVPVNSVIDVVFTTNTPVEQDPAKSHDPSLPTPTSPFPSERTKAPISILTAPKEVDRRITNVETFLKSFQTFTKGKLPRKSSHSDLLRVLITTSLEQLQNPRGEERLHSA
ncbi:unnamed protein product, partial [Allacma fusca]